MICDYLYLDTETFSEIPIQAGVHAYAERGEVMLIPWALDEGPVHVWDRTDGSPMPALLEAALADEEAMVVLHNSHFDRTMLRMCMGVDLPTTRIHDTLVQAFAHGLPGKLGQLCAALNVPLDKAKDQAGKNLIQRFCKPRPKNEKLRRATRETHPAEWAKFVEYARLDVEAMRECMKRMPKINLTPKERALWQLDQRINDRGIAVDRELVRAALQTVEEEQKILKGKTVEITDGRLASTTTRDQLLEYILLEHGIVLDNLRMSTVERALAEDDLPPALGELLRLRLQASTTSTTKYKALARATSADGRVRGLLQFAGAQRTNRWAGRIFQPQNLVRPTLSAELIESGIKAIKLHCAHLLADNVMEMLSNALRGTLVAAPGRKLVVADLSNIEGRAQAYIANEEWKLDAFRAYDAGAGPDLYKLAYARSFGIHTDEVTKDQRQVGKVEDLAFSYEGGVGACVTFAAGYGIDLDQMAQHVLSTADPELIEQAERYYEWATKKKLSTYGLERETFIGCDTLKRAWRAAHPAIVAYWAELFQAATNAVRNPGERFRAGRASAWYTAKWLFIRLPSGRHICYPGARVETVGERDVLSYMGMNQWTRKWERIKSRPGKVYENYIQAFARDIMAENMQPIEDADYPIVLSVHDELLTEPPDSPQFTAKGLSTLLAREPASAPGIPLAAAGFEAYRYKKE